MTIPGFLVRLLLTCALVFGTYNPSGRSYAHWMIEGGFEDWDLKLLATAVLIVLYGIYWYAIDHAVGIMGMTLAAVVIRAFFWVLYANDLIDVSSLTALTYAVLFGLSAWLAFGLSFSGFSHRISGQIDSVDLTKGH